MTLIPTPRLVAASVGAAVVAFVASSLAGYPVAATFATAAIVVIVLAAVDAMVGTSHAQLTVTRRHPGIVTLGVRSEIQWEVSSVATRPLRVMVADPLAPSLGADTRRFSIVVPPGSTAEVSTTIQPSRRGRFEIADMTVRIVGRWGLMARQRSVPLRTVLRVHPRFRSKDTAELRIRKARVLEIGSRSATGFGGGTDFDQMKDYMPDDEHRRIDWVVTARVGRPVVRTYRAEKNQHVLVLLDNGRVQAGLVEGVPRVEWAMDAALMLTTMATRLGDQCGLVTFDKRIRSVMAPSRRRDQVSAVAEAMYDLEPELSESDYGGVFAYCAGRFRRRMMIVLLTDLVEHNIHGALLPALPTLLRKHVVVVAAIGDPKIQSWAEPAVAALADGSNVDADGLSAPERATRRVAAIRALAAREATIARLRAMGVVVVDAPPREMASQLGDTYLRIKGTGRL